MKQEVKEIPFNDNTLLGVKDENGQVWLGVRKACRDIGLTEKQANNELEKIKKELLYNSCTPNLGWRLLHVKFDGQVREILVLAEKFVPMWLAKISLTPSMQRKNPVAVKKLLEYQLEAADTLHKAFYETVEQKDMFNAKMGIEGKIVDLEKQLKITVVQLNNVETTLELQTDRLNAVMDNMTLTTVQQGKLQRAVKERVNHLLGGAHSREYKAKSKLYFINLWNELKEYFNCGSRWQDLNPIYYNEAFDYILGWEYIEK